MEQEDHVVAALELGVWLLLLGGAVDHFVSVRTKAI